MRWLVVGADGMLGQDLTALLANRGHDVEGVDRTELDITDVSATASCADGFDVIVNAAAYTAVDRAESEEAIAFDVNARGAAHLARAARTAGARLVHVSTDYVFAGTSSEPYEPDALMAPRSAYGRTKAAGEWAVRAEAPDHVIVRTAWLYGAHGPCFPKTIARVAGEQGRLDVVDDQIGQPTWTSDLADLIEQLVVRYVPSGTYHGTSSGQTSWYDFARAIVASAGMDEQIVRPMASTAHVRPAARPAYSVLAHGSVVEAGVTPIGDWANRWAVAASEVLGPVSRP